MFRRIIKLAAHRERILALVLVPAFFLGTMPRAACICADGHRETSCRAATCRANSGCGCSCCKSHQCRSCCHSKPSHSADGLSAEAKCCQPIVEAPSPAVGADKLKSSSPQFAAIDMQPLSLN